MATFYGVKLTDATGMVYYTQIDTKQDIAHSYSKTGQLPIDSKYAYYTTPSKEFRYKGTCTADFENNTNGECEDDYTFGDTAWRLELVEWLHNGLTKILYLSDYLILPVEIIGDISLGIGRTVDDKTMTISFNWEQCDDKINSVADITCETCGQLLSTVSNYCSNCGTEVI